MSEQFQVEEVKLPTGEEVEKELLRREQENTHVLDNHAAFCALYYPRLMQMLNSMTRKGLLRVIELAMKHPIEESDKTFQSETERNAFNTLNQILTSKYIMLIHSAGEEMQKQAESAAKNAESVIETEFNGEENESKPSIS